MATITTTTDPTDAIRFPSRQPLPAIDFSPLDQGGNGSTTAFHVRRGAPAEQPPGAPPGPVDATHPLKFHHEGRLKDVPVPRANQLADLKNKRQQFHGFLNALVPGGVTAYRYQFSKKRVIYYARGVEHILKIDSSNRQHHPILKCIGELEDIVFQIRGERIVDSAYANSGSVILTGKVSPHYKKITPVLTKLEKSSFGDGIELAKKHYRAAHPQAPQRDIREALGRLNTFKRRL